MPAAVWASAFWNALRMRERPNGALHRYLNLEPAGATPGTFGIAQGKMYA
jgi:hypothetical protein